MVWNQGSGREAAQSRALCQKQQQSLPALIGIGIVGDKIEVATCLVLRLIDEVIEKDVQPGDPGEIAGGQSAYCCRRQNGVSSSGAEGEDPQCRAGGSGKLPPIQVWKGTGVGHKPILQQALPQGQKGVFEALQVTVEPAIRRASSCTRG